MRITNAQDDSSSCDRQLALLSEPCRLRTETSYYGSGCDFAITSGDGGVGGVDGDVLVEACNTKYGPKDCLTGLRNIGNTCYINSVLQCLSYTRSLDRFTLQGGHIPEVNTTSSKKGVLAKGFVELLQDLWTRTKESQRVVSPAPFV